MTGIGFQYSGSGIKANKYLYQGKEFQEDNGLNLYDFHTRGYDPVIGRTWQQDPHAENFFDWSPYSWGGNNPVLMIDPTGMDWFVSNRNGVLININGQSEFGFSNLQNEYGQEIANFIYELSGGASNDSWENFGADDMFDTKDNELSQGLGSLTMMTKESSEQFMLNNGYHKALEQRVSELDFTMLEQDPNGRSEDYGGKKEILSSKFTYRRLDEFGVFDKRELSAYNYPMLKMSRNIYTQVIHPSERGSFGSPIFDKSKPDFEKFGLDYYQDLVVPWMLKRKK